ncbi:transposase domain-containing protein [Deinococcus sp. UYEF24]
MNLGTALLTTARDQPLDHLDTFATSLDAALVTQALEATGTASVRRRKLPAERVVWLMLGMALLRDRSIQAVCDHLHLVLPDHIGKTTISSAGLVQARDRLGIAPLKHLFDAVVTRHGREQVDAHRWRGPAVLGIDGTTIRVPDSDENRAHFTLPSSGAHRESAYPQARVVGLMAPLVAFPVGSESRCVHGERGIALQRLR